MLMKQCIVAIQNVDLIVRNIILWLSSPEGTEHEGGEDNNMLST